MISRIKKIGIGLTAVAYLFPFVYMGILSVADRWSFPALFPGDLTVSRWGRLLSGQGQITQSFLLSAGLSIGVAAVATGAGFLTSKYIAYHRRRRWLMLGTYFPFILSPVIYAAFIYYYFVWLGVTGQLLGVFAGHLLLAYPYAIIVCTGFWSERAKKMEELTYTMGGSPLDTFRRVLFPMARGVLLMTFFQTFLISWFEYGLTTIIGVGKIQTLTLLVYQYITEANIYFAGLSSFLLILPPVILLLLKRRWLLARPI